MKSKTPKIPKRKLNTHSRNQQGRRNTLQKSIFERFKKEGSNLLQFSNFDSSSIAMSQRLIDVGTPINSSDDEIDIEQYKGEDFKSLSKMDIITSSVSSPLS